MPELQNVLSKPGTGFLLLKINSSMLLCVPPSLYTDTQIMPQDAGGQAVLCSTAPTTLGSFGQPQHVSQVVLLASSADASKQSCLHCSCCQAHPVFFLHQYLLTLMRLFQLLVLYVAYDGLILSYLCAAASVSGQQEGGGMGTAIHVSAVNMMDCSPDLGTECMHASLQRKLV